MTTASPPLSAETAALKEAHAALNRGDVAGFMRIFDPQIEFIEPPEFPGAGTYRGIDAVLAHVTKSRAAWAEGSCTPLRITVAGDRILQLVHVHVRLAHETEWRTGEVTEAYTFRNSRVIQLRLFADHQQALQWAGVYAADHEEKK